MQRLTRFSWFSIACFLFGMLIGSIAIGYFMLTLSPVPIGATVITITVAASPLCVFALVISRVLPSLKFLLAPTLLMGGLAVPLDVAFACLLGWIDHSALQAVTLCIASFSTIALIALHSTSNQRLNLALKVSENQAITSGPAPVTGAIPQ